jgi:hypothetical protein
MPGVLWTEVRPYWICCTSSSAVSAAEVYSRSFRRLQRKISREFRFGEWLGQDCGPCLVTKWVYITPNVFVMEIRCVTPCEACFDTEAYTTAKGEGTTSKILGVRWKLSRLKAHTCCKWYIHSNCSWRPYHTVVCHMFDSLYSMNVGRGILLYPSQYVLFDANCICTALSSAVYQRRVNSTDLPEAMTNRMKYVCSKSMMGILLCVPPYSCCTILTGFAKN